MSRCFPYPPPYCNESLIDSIKLQKEKENAKLEKKTEKKEKRAKKEKREKKEKNKEVKDYKEKKEKKEKKETKRKRDGHSLVPEHIQLKEQKQKQIVEEKCLLQDTQFYSTKSNDGNDLLEGSGVTEEHEPPCSIKQQNYESSESSQDSNKRRKLAAPLLSHNNNSTILRFKLPVSRENDREILSLPISGKRISESNSCLPVAGETASETKYQPLSAEGKPLLGSKDIKQISRPILKHKLASNASGDPTPSKIARKIDSRPDFLMTLGRNDSVRESPAISVRGQKDPGQNSIPLSSTPKLKFKVEGMQSHKLSAARQRDLQPAVEHSDLKSNFTSAQVEQKFESRPSLGKGVRDPDEQPCFSGQKMDVSHKIKSHKSKSRRHLAGERFCELFEEWKPPSLPLDCADIGDEDWLFGASKQQSSSCVSKSEVDANASSAIGRSCTSSLQPWATYMPELNMYMLPYTIPF